MCYISNSLSWSISDSISVNSHDALLGSMTDGIPAYMSDRLSTSKFVKLFGTFTMCFSISVCSSVSDDIYDGIVSNVNNMIQAHIYHSFLIIFFLVLLIDFVQYVYIYFLPVQQYALQYVSYKKQ